MQVIVLCRTVPVVTCVVDFLREIGISYIYALLSYTSFKEAVTVWYPNASRFDQNGSARQPFDAETQLAGTAKLAPAEPGPES